MIYLNTLSLSQEEYAQYEATSQLMFAVVNEGLRPKIPQKCPKVIQSIIAEWYVSCALTFYVRISNSILFSQFIR